MWPLRGASLLAAIVLIYELYCLVFRDNKWQRFHALTMIGVMVYPIGAELKFDRLGPTFLQWHVADLGFPIFMAMLMLAGFKFRPSPEGMPKFDYYDALLRWMRLCKLLIAIGMGFSYGYEVFIGSLVKWWPWVGQYVGGFDWLDIASYTVGGALGLFLFTWWQRSLNEYYRQARAQAELEAQPGHKARGKQRRRRGGRPGGRI